MPDGVGASGEARSVLRAHAAEWLGVVGRRRSRRSFDSEPADLGHLTDVRRLLSAWHPHENARVALVETSSAGVFRGLVGSYGKVTGEPHLLVFIAKSDSDFADQHLGYTGEAVVLEATRLGLATCWVAGFFSPRKAAQLVALEPGERILAVSPIGYALAEETVGERALAGLAGSHRRRPVRELAPAAADGGWPAWAVAAVETARLAPSASNRQPWRFRFEDGGLVVAKDNFIETPGPTKRLDVGIAMLHVDLAVAVHGVDGAWTDLGGADVARFDPT